MKYNSSRLATSESRNEYYSQIASNRNHLNDGYEFPFPQNHINDYEEVTRHHLNSSNNQSESVKRTALTLKKVVINPTPEKCTEYNVINVKVPDVYDLIRTLD